MNRDGAPARSLELSRAKLCIDMEPQEPMEKQNSLISIDFYIDDD